LALEKLTEKLEERVDEQTKDIGEKNKYLQELLNMKTDFLRVVNHQLNTPLAVMKGYFSMMEEGSYPPDKARPAIKGGLERISSTVSDFWDAYELEGERMKMEPKKTDIAEIVNTLIAEKQNLQLAQERKLKIEVQKPGFSAFGEKIPLVWCDCKKTAHVISNLLDNAVYYTRQGSVTVFYELVGKNYLKINVKDTGSGVSDQDKKKLFQKFSRGKNATDLRPDGSGLGLFIAKKIIEGNGGEMACVSAGANKGSTFSFTLPIYKNQKSTSGGEKPAAREKKIVIFDKPPR
jgi:signal transduction histidine kinase